MLARRLAVAGSVVFTLAAVAFLTMAAAGQYPFATVIGATLSSAAALTLSVVGRLLGHQLDP